VAADLRQILIVFLNTSFIKKTYQNVYTPDLAPYDLFPIPPQDEITAERASL
jgi:hypothetical protein